VRHKPIVRAAPAASPPRLLHFNVGRITLEGYSPSEQRRFRAALESNLARLERNFSGGAARDLTLHHLDAGQLAIAGPEAAARRIAARIVAALSGSENEHA
jgi:hypothetical protein